MTTEKSRQAANQQANKVRQSRNDTQQQKAQQVAQGVAQEVIEGLGNITNIPVGAPLDSSRGYSFEPGARPTDLPMPGEAPGGRPDRSQQSFTGNMLGDALKQQPQDPLPDDHDEIFDEGGPEATAALQRPSTAAKAPKIQKGPERPEHPILTKLRQDLGVEGVKTVDVTVGGHRWTMTLLAPADAAAAARLTDQLTDTPTERIMVSQCVIGTYSVVAIDGVPTYQVMGVDPPPGVTITDHMRPPRGVRYLAAARLFDFVNEGGRTELASKLHEAYIDKFNSAGEIESYLDNTTNKRIRFRCTEPNCGHELFIVPRVVPGTRDLQLPFCQWHGVPMPNITEAPGPLS